MSNVKTLPGATLQTQEPNEDLIHVVKGMLADAESGLPQRTEPAQYSGFDRTASHSIGELVEYAEPEQEPVAWMNIWGDLLRHHPAEYGRNDEHEDWKPLYTKDDTALLRQALEALEYEARRGNDDAYRSLRDALRKRLGEKV